ncbi:YdcF family protein [Lactococcus sp. dk322]|uniref:YdcF family protein n=1 Tax=Lactococcus sp. dk322 TaxID=2603290 RepID=UPI0011C70A23|nr:YdcF family protein [Lactococcus sp. dk322]TXK45323.1 hypothetical protein FVP43_11520 [Lactococcus sp. dk322]
MDINIIVILSIVSFLVIILAFICKEKTHKLVDIRTLRLGRFVAIFFICLFVLINCIMAILISASYNSNLVFPLLLIESFIILIPYFIVSFIVPVTIVFLTIRVWRKESHSLSNLILPAILFMFFLVTLLYNTVSRLSDDWLWLQILSYIYPILSIYLLWQFLIFFFASWKYGRLSRNKYSKYHVILGAGLIRGKYVSPLLANRIQAGIKEATDETIIIFSGGKGHDEEVSEAFAMQKYAIEELNFPKERTLIEDKSVTTFENLKFSSVLIEKTENKTNQSFLFFSSDYHVFRAALFAAQQKLNAHGGVGGKTPLYFRLPAFIREFIALLNMQRKKHLFWVVFIISILSLFAATIFVIQHLVIS